MYTRHCRRDCVRRRPTCLEKIKADFAGLEVDIGVADGGREADRRRGVGVGGGDVDGEGPEAAWGELGF
jgi:hypothetical protein